MGGLSPGRGSGHLRTSRHLASERIHWAEYLRYQAGYSRSARVVQSAPRTRSGALSRTRHTGARSAKLEPKPRETSVFDPFTAKEFQEGLRKWDRLQGEAPAAPESDEPAHEATRGPEQDER